MDDRSYQNSEGGHHIPSAGYYDGNQEQYQSPDGIGGEGNPISFHLTKGMYANEEDVYGDEIDADEDKNDGLNALVSLTFFIISLLESTMGYWH
jgi:hypothetical protein